MIVPLNISGLVIAFVTFIFIGVFHVLVVKIEYYFGKKPWPIFALAGCISLGASLLTDVCFLSAIAAIFGATCLWSIRELFEQEKRVAKGWFPKREASTNHEVESAFVPDSSNLNT